MLSLLAVLQVPSADALAGLDPVAAIGATLGSMALGFLKSKTTILDAKVGAFVKPLQPLLVATAGIALPYATDRLGVDPVDPETLVSAFATTLLLVTAREGFSRISGRK